MLDLAFFIWLKEIGMNENTFFVLCIFAYILIGVMFVMVMSEPFTDVYEAAAMGAVWPLIVCFFIMAGIYLLIGKSVLWFIRPKE